MANTLGDLFQDIANAIRSKTGDSEKLTPSEFATEIASIQTGSGTTEEMCYVTFMSEDGSTELYKRAVVVGNDCGDVVSLGLIDTPIKESTNTQTFTHNGWSLTAGGSASDAALKNVTADRTVYTAFNASTRYYTVRFFDGDTLLETIQVEYGATANYTPTKDGYQFAGWQPGNADIIADTDCYAQWETELTFANATWEQISEISEAGTASDYFTLGDTKTVRFNDTEDITFEILAFNHDKKATGEKAGITLLAKSVTTDFTVSEVPHTGLNTWFSEISTALLGRLPSNVQDVIKPVMKECDTTYDNGSKAKVEKELSVWFPSMYEAGVSKTSQIAVSGVTNSTLSTYATQLGTPYTVFSLGHASIAQMNNDWLTRTAMRQGAGAKFFYGKTSEAKYQYNSISNLSSCGFLIGFCV